MAWNILVDTSYIYQVTCSTKLIILSLLTRNRPSIDYLKMQINYPKRSKKPRGEFTWSRQGALIWYVQRAFIYVTRAFVCGAFAQSCPHITMLYINGHIYFVVIVEGDYDHEELEHIPSRNANPYLTSTKARCRRCSPQVSNNHKCLFQSINGNHTRWVDLGSEIWGQKRVISRVQVHQVTFQTARISNFIFRVREWPQFLKWSIVLSHKPSRSFVALFFKGLGKEQSDTPGKSISKSFGKYWNKRSNYSSLLSVTSLSYTPIKLNHLPSLLLECNITWA